MNIELYIANKLCDLEKSDLAIRLKRQFINPSELNAKDSQKSYNIALPSTPTNDHIFRYSNVEETEGKFSTYPDAKLYVNGILILEGKFRLTEITRHSYRGNLGVPTPLTVKDVFGERKMNEGEPWMIDFKDATSMSEYNKKENPTCIFPFALYGLLQKTSAGNRTAIDHNTKFRIEDFPPSTNCIELLKEIFSQAKYDLSGTALSDQRLKNLYVSYRNPNEYVMPYNYKKVVIEGNWSNAINPNRIERRTMINPHQYAERYTNNEEKHVDHNFVACDLFQSDNLQIVNRDDESNILQITEGNKVTYRVPKDGFYKIKLEGTLSFSTAGFWRQQANDMNNNPMYIVQHRYIGKNNKYFRRNLNNVLCELKLVRTNDDKFDLSKVTVDNFFNKINREEEGTVADPNLLPTTNNVHFVDVADNPYLLCGLAWGRAAHDNFQGLEEGGSQYYPIPESINRNHSGEQRCNPIATKHGRSDDSDNTHDTSLAATYSPGYANGKYNVNLINAHSSASVNYKKPVLVSGKGNDPEPLEGKGNISQVIWLNAGEVITILATTDKARDRDWVRQDINFKLEIEPFSPYLNWLKMDAETGSSIGEMNFDGPIEFPTSHIDLMKFQPQETKIDDWISNFCKAFNLQLTHVGKDRFELNLKSKANSSHTSKIIDLDSKTSVQHAVNENMALPSTYELGFTIDTAEQGYVESIKDGKINEGNTGGGKFETGNKDANKITQNSSFSYCWHKTLTDNTQGGKDIEVPVITDKEVWIESNGYKEMAAKKYFNKAQRFWYKRDKTKTLKVNGRDTDIALVSNTYRGSKPLQLDYEDKPDSIMRNYFMLFTNEKNYTVVECYLTPEEYNDLGQSYIRLNGDLYLVAEADGYDPMNVTKTKLKLIKKK